LIFILFTPPFLFVDFLCLIFFGHFYGQDSRLVIERYKSGFSPPEDVPFEDLSNMRSGSVGSDSSSNGGGSGAIHSTISLTSSGILKSESKGGTLTAMKLKKRAGIFSIFNAGKVTSLSIATSYPLVYSKRN
jgi:hypothetical protein